MTDPAQDFRHEKAVRVEAYAKDEPFKDVSNAWTKAAFERLYMYNFEALGRPIIQLPCDIVAISEIIWNVKPDLVVETGIAHGGSVVHSAAALAMVELAEAARRGTTVDPRKPLRKVVAVDIDIRDHNRAALETHPFKDRMELIEGSSLDPDVIKTVTDLAKTAETVLVVLDSNHTHEHVLEELRAYAPLVSKGSYCVVFDTIVEHLPKDFFPNRPWNPGDSPLSAIAAFQEECRENPVWATDGAALELTLDRAIDDKLMTSAAPGGFLRRTG